MFMNPNPERNYKFVPHIKKILRILEGDGFHARCETCKLKKKCKELNKCLI